MKHNAEWRVMFESRMVNVVTGKRTSWEWLPWYVETETEASAMARNLARPHKKKIDERAELHYRGARVEQLVGDQWVVRREYR